MPKFCLASYLSDSCVHKLSSSGDYIYVCIYVRTYVLYALDCKRIVEVRMKGVLYGQATRVLLHLTLT